MKVEVCEVSLLFTFLWLSFGFKFRAGFGFASRSGSKIPTIYRWAGEGSGCERVFKRERATRDLNS